MASIAVAQSSTEEGQERLVPHLPRVDLERHGAEHARGGAPRVAEVHLLQLQPPRECSRPSGCLPETSAVAAVSSLSPCPPHPKAAAKDEKTSPRACIGGQPLWQLLSTGGCSWDAACHNIARAIDLNASWLGPRQHGVWSAEVWVLEQSKLNAQELGNSPGRPH